MKYNSEFFCGYSPERINPGDKKHRIKDIKKITSGSTDAIANIVNSLYNQIIEAGTHKAESIKVAEAAKVIENTQRDINIALINELAIIFEKIGVDTEAVLEAAGTKWNFFPFRPGLVGGHCIGVDPYYLTFKAQAVGHYPEIILAGRQINDRMGNYVASQMIKFMIKKKIRVDGSKILIMGLTFKENCPDLRNSKVFNIVRELKEYNCKVDVFDMYANKSNEIEKDEINLIEKPSLKTYDGIIIAVAHDKFIEMGTNSIRDFGKNTHVLYDLKYILPPTEVRFKALGHGCVGKSKK